MSTRLKSGIVAILLAVIAQFAVAGETHDAGEITYHLTTLQSFDYDSWVSEVNDVGHAVIENSGEDGLSGWVFWSPETGYRDLLIDYEMIYVTGLNNLDQVLGIAPDGGVAIWSPQDLVTFGPPAGYSIIFPKAIDDKGVVTGWVAATRTSPTYSFRRLPDGTMTVDKPGRSSCALAMNNRGGVVVQSDDSQIECQCYGTHKLTLIQGRKAFPIETPSEQACLIGMNDAGHVAVIAGNDTGFWSPERGFVPIEIGGTDSLELAGISDHDLVFGNTYSNSLRTFVWDAKTGHSHWLKPMIDQGDQIQDLSIRYVSPKGVLGGRIWNAPIVLMPSR